MSLCRWSHKSDVYIYITYDGAYSVNVRGTTADEASQSLDTIAERLEKASIRGELDDYKAIVEDGKATLQGVVWKPLESKYAGNRDNVLACNTYVVENVDDLIDLLIDMRKDGVRVPREVFAYLHSNLSQELEKGL